LAFEATVTGALLAPETDTAWSAVLWTALATVAPVAEVRPELAAVTPSGTAPAAEGVGPSATDTPDLALAALVSTMELVLALLVVSEPEPPAATPALTWSFSMPVSALPAAATASPLEASTAVDGVGVAATATRDSAVGDDVTTGDGLADGFGEGDALGDVWAAGEGLGGALMVGDGLGDALAAGEGLGDAFAAGAGLGLLWAAAAVVATDVADFAGALVAFVAAGITTVIAVEPAFALVETIVGALAGADVGALGAAVDAFAGEVVADFGAAALAGWLELAAAAGFVSLGEAAWTMGSHEKGPNTSVSATRLLTVAYSHPRVRVTDWLQYSHVSCRHPR
jgi:hypothetical protein